MMAKKMKTPLASAASQSKVPLDYSNFLNSLKSRIQTAQLKAAASVNLELTSLYWDIGQRLKKTNREGWGSKIVERLAADLAGAFPGVAGFSKRNLELMRQFAESYPDGIYETAVSQIPWGHNIVLMQRLGQHEDRLWYAQQTIKNGWSRNVLVMWIESELHKRKGRAVNNFALTLPEPHSDLAVESLKDPYRLDFLTLSAEAREKEKNKITAEYALSNLKSPIGVSSYTMNLVEKLPKELKGKLPTIAEIEMELSSDIKNKKTTSIKSKKT